MEPKHFAGVIELQELAFPLPFDRDLLWKEEHLVSHTNKFPIGQIVAVANDRVVGSCSNSVLNSDWFDQGLPWKEMVGGYSIATFDSNGKTLYGLDISVHPEFRKQGIGRAFYEHRKTLVCALDFERYATTCRIPDFHLSSSSSGQDFCQEVKNNRRSDRTLTPLLRYGMNFVSVIENHWDDPESGNAAVRLEWYP